MTLAISSPSINTVNSQFLRNMTDDQIRAACRSEAGQKLIDRAFPGTRVTSHDDLPSALDSVGANFGVELRPVYTANHVDGFENSGAMYTRDPDFEHTARTDTDARLGIVGKGSYGVVQTLEALRPLDILARRGDVEIVNVELIGGGARIRVTALLGMTSFASIGGAPNTLCNFAVFETSHDGNSSASAVVYTLRVECFNGMTSRDLVTKHTLRHTSKAADRMEAYTETILRELIGDVQAEAAVFADLAQRAMVRPQFEAFAVDLLGGELADDASKAMVTRRENNIEELLGYFEGGNQGAGATAWGAYNTVTRWIEAKREGLTDASKAAKKFGSNLEGAGQKLIAKALRKLR